MTITREFEALAKAFGRASSTANSGLSNPLMRYNQARNQSSGDLYRAAGLSGASALGSALLGSLLGGFESGGLGGISGGINPGRGDTSASRLPTLPGGSSASGIGDLLNNRGVQLGLTNALSQLFEGLTGDLFARTRTRTSTAESQRSIDAASRWNVSRSQQDAELARIVSRGQSQL